MDCTVARLAAHSVRALLVTMLLACATSQPQPGAQLAGANDFDAAVSPLHQKARQITSLPDVIIIGFLPNNAPTKNNLTYIPSEMHVIGGTKVAWISWQGPFTLTYDINSPDPWPFKEPFGDITPSNTSPPYWTFRTTTKAAAAIAPATRRAYHFKVEVKDGSNTYKDPDCPPIIIH